MDYEDLPLPPNWEARFDDVSKRWYFANHAKRTTTWKDPRTNYYGSSSVIGSASKNSNQGTTSSINEGPQSYFNYVDLSEDADEVEEEVQAHKPDQTEEFSGYLEALRANYPSYKDCQLANLLEQYLGKSDELHEFITNHLKRKTSHSKTRGSKSKTRRSKRPRQSSTCTESLQESVQDGSLVKSSDNNSSIETQPLAFDPPVPDIQASQSIVSEPTNIVSGATESRKLEDSQQDDTAETPWIPILNNSKNDRENQAPSIQYGLVERVQGCERCVPFGPDVSLLGERIRARGPNPSLPVGPNFSIVLGPSFKHTLRID